MDAKLQWKVSSDVEGLVEALVRCKQELLTGCVLKHGMKVHLLSCDAYAGDKVLELLRLSDRWTPCDDEEVDLSVPEGRRLYRSTQRVADFGAFKLHRMPIMGEEAVRLLAILNVGDNADQVWFGNVELVQR